MSYNQKSALLFQLVMRHGYFNDGLAKGLDVCPTAGAQTQLSRFGGRFVADVGGGFVVYPLPLLSPSDTAPQGLPDNLSLALNLGSPQFSIYTDIADLPAGQVWYSNNLGPLPDQASALQALPLRPSRFTVNWAGPDWPAQPGSSRQLKVVRLNGQVVMDRKSFQAPGDSLCRVDLSGWSDGGYTLTWTVEGAASDFSLTFFKWDAGMQPPPFGFFEWYAQGTAPSPIGAAIHMDFQARETLWQYYLVSRSGKKVKDPVITLSSQQARFVQTGKMLLLPNGSYATCLSSTSPLPLQERPSFEVTLRTRTDTKGMALPYATPNLLYDSGGGQPSSRIYIYF
jgi:hypothetical protein